MSIGKRIKKTREDLKLTQEYVAKKVGVAIQTIYKYENEIVTNIPLDKLEKIAKALRTTPAYLMGWEEQKSAYDNYPSPTITEDYVTFPVIGEVAAGYDHIAIEDWDGDTIDIPLSYLKGRKQSDFFVLRVIGNSMYPLYRENDKVLVLKQTTLNHSGDIGVLLYDDDVATLKKVEYENGEDWLRMVPINPEYEPKMIEGEALEHCRVIGIPKLLIREI